MGAWGGGRTIFSFILWNFTPKKLVSYIPTVGESLLHPPNMIKNGQTNDFFGYFNFILGLVGKMDISSVFVCFFCEFPIYIYLLWYLFIWLFLNWFFFFLILRIDRVKLTFWRGFAVLSFNTYIDYNHQNNRDTEQFHYPKKLSEYFKWWFNLFVMYRTIWVIYLFFSKLG